MDIRDEAMQLRNEKHQMIKTGLNAKMENSHDLAVVYTPGVAAPCLAIKEEEDKSLELTWRGNVVAVISDGTRIGIRRYWTGCGYACHGRQKRPLQTFWQY